MKTVQKNRISTVVISENYNDRQMVDADHRFPMPSVVLQSDGHITLCQDNHVQMHANRMTPATRMMQHHQIKCWSTRMHYKYPNAVHEMPSNTPHHQINSRSVPMHEGNSRPRKRHRSRRSLAICDITKVYKTWALQASLTQRQHRHFRRIRRCNRRSWIVGPPACADP